MKTTEIIQIAVISSALIGGVAVAVSNFMGSDSPQEVTVQVNVPQLSNAAQRGEKLYNKSCISCHGENGSGSQAGPPLIHDIYNPGHHGDESFYRAVRQGVQRHHWQFGNMPPRPEVSRQAAAYIVEYVRELQRANGIQYSEHRM